MAKTISARTVRLALLLCVLVGAVSVAAFSATGASAGPLEGVTGPVGEVVGEPVREVTETVTEPIDEAAEVVPPVHEVTETVTPPVHEVTETVTAPVREATESVTAPVHEEAEKVTGPVSTPAKGTTEAVTAPVKEAAGTVTSSSGTAPARGAVTEVVHAATDTAGSSSTGAGKTAGNVVQEATGTATHTASEATVTATSAGDRHGVAAAVVGGGQTEVMAPQQGDRPNITPAAPDAGPGRDTFETFSTDGSLRAPLGRLMSYVWPAVALTRSMLADLLRGRGGPDLVAALYSAAGGAGAGQVHVDGVSAASGSAWQGGGGSSASSSLFSKVPHALGDFFTPKAPLPEMVFLLIVALAVIVLFVAVGWDVGLFDRYRRRWP